jgi:hypothetical protein
VRYIFECVDELVAMGWDFAVTASYLEIYNESIRDLLRSGKHDPSIKVSGLQV